MFRAFFTSAWYRYKNYVELAMQLPGNYPVQDIVYWQNRLFINAILYALPASIIASIPCVYVECVTGKFFLAGFDIAALVIVFSIALQKGISLELRKIMVTVIIAVFAIIATVLIGGFTMGCIYLFSLSVFVSLQFSDKAAYGTVIFNALVCILLGLIIYYKLIDGPIVTSSFDQWIIYSANFIFMDLIVVGLIRQILNGLERTMKKEAWFFQELQKEIIEKAQLNHELKNSEQDYKTLFYQSPSPKFIFDLETLNFLQVNLAATRIYGYTEDEF